MKKVFDWADAHGYDLQVTTGRPFWCKDDGLEAQAIARERAVPHHTIEETAGDSSSYAAQRLALQRLWVAIQRREDNHG